MPGTELATITAASSALGNVVSTADRLIAFIRANNVVHAEERLELQAQLRALRTMTINRAIHDVAELNFELVNDLYLKAEMYTNNPNSYAHALQTANHAASQMDRNLIELAETYRRRF